MRQSRSQYISSYSKPSGTSQYTDGKKWIVVVQALYTNHCANTHYALYLLYCFCFSAKSNQNSNTNVEFCFCHILDFVLLNFRRYCSSVAIFALSFCEEEENGETVHGNLWCKALMTALRSINTYRAPAVGRFSFNEITAAQHAFVTFNKMEKY